MIRETLVSLEKEEREEILDCRDDLVMMGTGVLLEAMDAQDQRVTKVLTVLKVLKVLKDGPVCLILDGTVIPVIPVRTEPLVFLELRVTKGPLGPGVTMVKMVVAGSLVQR